MNAPVPFWPCTVARALQSLDLILPARRLPVQPASARQDQQIFLSSDDCWWLVAAGLVHRLVASRLGLPAPPGAALAGEVGRQPACNNPEFQDIHA